MRRYFKKNGDCVNEFDEIRQLKVSGSKTISRDDITDFQIDFGLHNKKLEAELKEQKSKAPRPRGKKKVCDTKKRAKTPRRRIQKVVKKSKSSSRPSKKSSASGTLGFVSSLYAVLGFQTIMPKL